jgi:hypothetical protein
MLIRLKVKGFKSLADVEVRFGPLTCVIGPNGAGDRGWRCAPALGGRGPIEDDGSVAACGRVGNSPGRRQSLRQGKIELAAKTAMGKIA